MSTRHWNFTIPVSGAITHMRIDGQEYKVVPDEVDGGFTLSAMMREPFTWEDVDLLRWAVQWAKVDAVREDSPKRVADLADRIESLLPPREP